MRHAMTHPIIILSVLFLTACSEVSLRKDVFLSTPVWESRGPLSSLQTISETPDPRSISERQLLAQAPPVLALVRQVLQEDLAEPKAPAELNALAMQPDKPLPTEIAQLAVTRALVLTLRESYFSAKGLDREQKLPEVKLSSSDFRQFAEALNRAALEPYRDNGVFESAVADDTALPWRVLFQKYLSAYYRGKFIDRTGGRSSKPKLGITITNESIAGLAHVFLESIWDWAIIGSDLRVPIVFEGDAASPKFITAEQNTPTLWEVLKNSYPSPPTDRLFEKVGNNENPGSISKAKLCVIRTVSGVAGDAAQSASGMIVRAFGGVDIGFVILGKISVGDNDTLSKIVDTWTESTGRRATEAALANRLYRSTLPPKIAKLCAGD